MEDRKCEKRDFCLQCSFTVEAALAFSLMIFFFLAILTPLRTINWQRNASSLLEKNARQLSVIKYVEYASKKNIKISEDAINIAEELFSEGLLQEKINSQGFRMESCELMSESSIDSEYIKYVLNYRVKIPLFNFSIPMKTIAYRRAWIGADGQRWEENDDEEEEEEETVYVSHRDTLVYHTSLSCSYISHNIKAVSGGEIRDLRTPSGARYSPCDVCCPSYTMETVYYSEGSSNFHSSMTCRTMKSDVYEKTKKEALLEGRHVCVRCGR